MIKKIIYETYFQSLSGYLSANIGESVENPLRTPKGQVLNSLVTDEDASKGFH